MRHEPLFARLEPRVWRRVMQTLSKIVLVSIIVPCAVHASPEPTALAERALNDFELTKAAQYADQAIEQNGYSADALYLRARIEILQYRFDNAIALSRQCIDEFPQAAICSETLGEARSFAMVREDKLMKQVKLARRSRDDWLHAVELDSDNVRARIQLIRYYRLVPWILGGSKRKAREQAEAITRIDADRSAEAYGMMNFYEKDWKGAIKHLAVAVEQHPEDGELRYHLARARGERGNLEQAVSELTEIVASNPEFWEAWFHLGIWCVEADADHETCFSALETYVNGAVDSGEKRLANAYYAMGKLREQRGELDLALAAYENALVAKHGHNESRDGAERLRAVLGES